MSSTVTIRQSRGVGVVGLISIIAGVLMIVAGGVTWWAVADKLSQEGIVVSEDASFLAGKKVNDPFSAFAQADVINKHALSMSDGKTYAELERDDPRRDTVMNASFLRASLFTSVVSFGIAALVAGLGVLFILVGWALRRVAGGPPVVVETSAGTRTAGASSTSAQESPSRRVAGETVAPPAGVPVASEVPATGSTRATSSSAAKDPVRLSRSDRAATPSPAPAGERPATVTASTPPVTASTPAAGASATGADEATPEASAPAKDDRLGGWASPADRVTPPADRTAAPEQTDGSDEKH